MNTKRPYLLVLECDTDGIITRVVYRENRLKGKELEGKHIRKLFADEHQDRIDTFLGGFPSGNIGELRQLRPELKDLPETLHLTGVVFHDCLGIIVGPDSAEWQTFIERMKDVDSQYRNYLLNILARARGSEELAFYRNEEDLLADFIDLNNELVNKQRELSRKNAELEHALEEVRRLQGLVPICSHCKKIKDNEGYWQEVEAYIEEHAEVRFSHGVCNDCLVEYYPEFADKVKRKDREP